MSIKRPEDYSTGRAYFEALRDEASTHLLDLKAMMDSVRDDFIALEDPTPELARWYREIEHLFATSVGMRRYQLRLIELALKLPDKPEDSR